MKKYWLTCYGTLSPLYRNLTQQYQPYYIDGTYPYKGGVGNLRDVKPNPLIRRIVSDQRECSNPLEIYLELVRMYGR